MACCSCITGRGTRELAGVRPRKSNCHRHVCPLTFYLSVWAFFMSLLAEYTLKISTTAPIVIK